jgi:hypothetical protein
MWRGSFLIVLFVALLSRILGDRGRTLLWASIVLVLVCYAGFVALALRNVH